MGSYCKERQEQHQGVSPLPAPNALADHFSGLHIMGSSGSGSQRMMDRSFSKVQKAQDSDHV